MKEKTIALLHIIATHLKNICVMVYGILYNFIDDLLLFTGLACISYAGFFIHEAVGWFLTGAAFIFVAHLVGNRREE